MWALANKKGGVPEVAVIPAFNPEEYTSQEEGTTDPLNSTFNEKHFDIEVLPQGYLSNDETAKTLKEILSDAVFASDSPPRYVLLVGEIEWVLIERFKWHASRSIRFDLSEILGKKQPATLNVFP